MSKQVTIADVAKRVGVSRSTVSHVLTKKRPISKEVQRRVHDAIEELGYQPSIAARMLREKRSRIIGFLVDTTINPTAGLTCQLLADAFRQKGYTALTAVCGTDRETAFTTMKQLSSGFCDGILNLLPQISVQEAITTCYPVPVVTFMRGAHDAPIHVDFEAGYNRALDHLWQLGHRRIGIIVDDRSQSMDDRDEPKLVAYRQYMESRGCYDSRFVRHGAGTIDDGAALGAMLYRQGCTAIMAGNDMMACGVFSWAKEENVRIPQDLSVIGYDDIPLARLLTPTLTTLQHPAADTIVPTVEAMIDKIEGKTHPKQEHIVVPRFVRRESTGICPD